MAARKDGAYYGGLFWVSLVAFVVPLFVAAAAFQAARAPYTKPVPHPDASGVDNAIWDYLLKQYVENGLIDYDGMKRDRLFTTYLAELGRARPEALATDEDRLALLCNAYNAFVVGGVINHKITTSVMDFKGSVGFFDLKEHIFAGKTVSANDVEHKLIRPVYQEPRIHMALVCAAISCPAIRREAYTGPDLQRQLEDQAVRFANNPVHVSYDAAKNRVHLSSILQWYGDDFKKAGGYLAFLARRTEDPGLAEALRRAEAGKVTVVFDDYDWALNSRAIPAAGKKKRSTTFGSGSIPNE